MLAKELLPADCLFRSETFTASIKEGTRRESRLPTRSLTAYETSDLGNNF